MKRKLKIWLGGLVLVITAAAFFWYIHGNPAVVDKLMAINPLFLVLLLFLYAGSYVGLLLVMSVQLRFYAKRIPFVDNFLVNAYASLVNFFGPGQAGPGVRAVYLKQKLGLLIRAFFYVTLLYYACFAVVSSIFLFGLSVPFWQSMVATIAAIGISCGVLALFRKRSKQQHIQPKQFWRMMGLLLLATFVQLAFQMLAFWAELRSVDSSVGFAQALTYSGAANFAVFVALTPGAIGIRESLLLFTGGLHGISPETVVAASVLDRGINLVFLGILFIFVLSMHAQKKLGLTKSASSKEQN